jgi:hypothetical protein
MSLDKTIALVDVDEVKEYLQIDTDTDTTDPWIEKLINAASKRIENYCRGRKFILVTTAIDEIFDGNGTSSYFTKYAPIVSTISTIYYWDGDSWAALTGETHTQNNVKGELYFTDGNRFTKGIKNWKISYTYGWALNSVPADLKDACLMMIGQKKKLFEDNLHGVSSKSFGDQSISYSFDMNKEIKAILNTYIRYH